MRSWLATGSSIALLAIAACRASPPPTPPDPAAPALPANTGAVRGVVRDMEGQRVADATVVLECTCLPRARFTRTNANGLYAIDALPPGEYELHVIHGHRLRIHHNDLKRGDTWTQNTTLPAYDTIEPVRVIVDGPTQP